MSLHINNVSHRSDSRGSEPRLIFIKLEPPRLREWLSVRGAVRFSLWPISSSPLGPSKLVSRIWPMLLDLSLTLSAVSILARTSSSSSDVSRSRDDSSCEGRELQGGGGLLDGGAGGGGSVPLPIVTWAKGFAYPGTEGIVMLSLAGIFGRDRP